MILSKYPFVVQKEIIDNMSHLDLLLLSFVSKNMKKLIMSSQKKRSKCIRSIEYAYNRMDGTCVVYMIDESKPLEKYQKRSARNVDDMLMKIVEQEKAESDHIQMDLSGKTIDFRIDGEYKYPVASYHEYDKESVFQSIHNHFLDIFGDTVEYNWEAPFWRLPEECFTPFVPNLKNVSFCIGMYLDGHFADVGNFENFFSSFPVAKMIQLYVHKKMEPLNPESKFYQAETIHVDSTKIIGPDFLRHFQGKQFSFNCGIYEKSNLIDFVNRWKSGEAFQNLEYAQIRIVHNNRFLHGILNEIGVKYINANRQPPTHALGFGFSWHDRNSTIFQINSHTYIVRKSDNRVASVQISIASFLFGVWDKTEEEFLKMVK
ncbi:unnamed protein product [Caenorhabditis nigoni]